MKSARKKWHDPKDAPFYTRLTPPEEKKPVASVQEDVVAEPARIKTDESALRFILGGNATFTLRSKKTSTRYTYKVKKAETSQDGTPMHHFKETWFVSLLSGPDNNSDYVYLGIIRDNVFSLTRKSKMNLDSVPVKAFRWAFAHLLKYNLPAELEIWHEGRCGRCNRKLTVPESIATGFGPECAGRMEGGL